MKFQRLARLVVLLIAASTLSAQVQTEVPPTVPGAKPVTVERIKIHGDALEGNSEQNAVDREVFVFLAKLFKGELRSNRGQA